MKYESDILILLILCILIKIFIYKPNQSTYDVHNETGFCYIHTLQVHFLISHMSKLEKSAERTLNTKNRNTSKIWNTVNRDNHRKTQQQKKANVIQQSSMSACELPAVYCWDLTKIETSTSNLSTNSNIKIHENLSNRNQFIPRRQTDGQT